MKEPRGDRADQGRDAVAILVQLSLQALAEVGDGGVAKLLERRQRGAEGLGVAVVAVAKGPGAVQRYKMTLRG